MEGLKWKDGYDMIYTDSRSLFPESGFVGAKSGGGETDLAIRVK